MRTRVFSPTYPTWALVGGTSRPAGGTVDHCDTMLLVCPGDLWQPRHPRAAGHRPLPRQRRGDQDRVPEADEEILPGVIDIDMCRYHYSSDYLGMSK